MLHESWMRLALKLASMGKGQTSPNPMVGAVVVKDGKAVGLGAHLGPGTPHAEVHALNMAGPKSRGSTLYVTLEPCNHYGRTPPCTEKVIACGVSRVVVGHRDPDPKVAGQGIRRLRDAGIEVVENVLKQPCEQLNEAYIHQRKTQRPFVTMKVALTLDGKIATHTGDSRWITGEEARRRVHVMRSEQDGIMAGIGTVLKDRPRLTARLPHIGKNPLRIIVDSRLRTPLDSPVVDTETAPTWIFCLEKRDKFREEQLMKKGVRVIPAGDGERVDLKEVTSRLGREGILSVLLEGGGNVNASMMENGLIDKVVAFLAPKMVGGHGSSTALEGRGISFMKEAWRLHRLSLEQVGEDICVTGYVVKRGGR